MTKPLSKQLRRIAKISVKRKFEHDYDNLAERARMKAHIDKVQHDGLIGLDWHKMDCDHAKWGGHSHIQATVMHFVAWENAFYDDAEGPQSVFIVTPRDETGRLYERDLALEAFENGHSHCIHI